jgi:hypothetical protein
MIAVFATSAIGRLGSVQNADVSLDRWHVPSALDSLRWLPVPRQQLVEPIDRMSVDHPLEHVMQISVGLDVIHLAGLCRPANYAEQARFPHDSH